MDKVVAAFNEAYAKDIAFGLDRIFQIPQLKADHTMDGREELHAIFANYEEVVSKLEEGPRLLFLLLAAKQHSIEFNPAKYSEEAYQAEYEHDIQDVRTETQKSVRDKRAAFISDPFMTRLRETVFGASKENAAALIQDLLKQEKYKIAVLAYEFFTSVFNSQHFRKYGEHENERFSEYLAETENDAVLFVQAQKGHHKPGLQFMGRASAPNYVIVLNSPFDASNPDEPPMDLFTIVTEERVFKDLKSFIVQSLKESPGSLTGGKYSMNTSSGISIAGAIHLVAELLYAIKKGSNFQANAIARINAQLDSVKDLFHGGDYGYRFLKERGEPEWARAIWARSHSKDCTEEAHFIGYRTARDLLMDDIFNGWFAVSRDPHRAAEFYKGVLAGMNDIFADMQEVSSFNDAPSEALERFKVRRGFHPSLNDVDVPAQKALVFRDLGEQLRGLINTNEFNQALFYRGEESKEAQSILAEFLLAELFKFYLKTKYIDGINNIACKFKFFGEVMPQEIMSLFNESEYSRFTMSLKDFNATIITYGDEIYIQGFKPDFMEVVAIANGADVMHMAEAMMYLDQLSKSFPERKEAIKPVVTLLKQAIKRNVGGEAVKEIFALICEKTGVPIDEIEGNVDLYLDAALDPDIPSIRKPAEKRVLSNMRIAFDEYRRRKLRPAFARMARALGKVSFFNPSKNDDHTPEV